MLMFDVIALGATPTSGKARQSALWTSSTMTVLRGMFAAVPLSIAQLREKDFVGAAGSFCQLVRPISGYLITSEATDPYWILFGVSQVISAGADLGAGSIQIFQAVTDTDGLDSSLQPASA